MLPRHDLSIGSPVLFNDWNSKTVKASIVEAWNCLVKNDPFSCFHTSSCAQKV